MMPSLTADLERLYLDAAYGLGEFVPSTIVATVFGCQVSGKNILEVNRC
jgi:hypothetical protein